MTELQEKILEFTMFGQTLEEMSNTLNIPKREIKVEINELRRIGYNIVRQFYYNGVQKYYLDKSVPEDYTNILGIPKNDTFRALASSDYHIGSVKENLDYINILYEFAINNCIHVIFNGGDLIEGHLNRHKHQTREEQISYLLEKHPKDDSIINFITLGNHDADLIKHTGIDLHTILNLYRDDLVSLGYGINKIKLRYDDIILSHIASDVTKTNAKLKITGHGHRYQFKVAYGMPTLFLPTLSNEIKDGFPPGFVDINIDIKDGKFAKGVFTYYIIINNKPLRVSNSVFNYETDFISNREKTMHLSKFH